MLELYEKPPDDCESCSLETALAQPLDEVTIDEFLRERFAEAGFFAGPHAAVGVDLQRVVVGPRRQLQRGHVDHDVGYLYSVTLRMHPGT